MEQKRNLQKDRMKVLITGSEGFIGTHLKEALKDYELICIDKKGNYHENKCHGIDLAYDLGHIKKIIQDQKPEIVIHLAAVAEVTYSLIDVTQNNILATVHLLEACKDSSVKKIIFSSSCAVYGKAFEISRETDNLDPISYYGQSKLIGELFIKTFCKQNHIHYQILRFGNVYGKGGHGVINAWMSKRKENKPIEMYGDGHQLRDYIFVDDIVAAIKLVMKEDLSMILNVGTGKEIDLWDILNILQKELGGLKINSKGKRKEDIYASRLDISKFKRLFYCVGWNPIGLKEGIKKLRW